MPVLYATNRFIIEEIQYVSIAASLAIEAGQKSCPHFEFLCYCINSFKINKYLTPAARLQMDSLWYLLQVCHKGLSYFSVF